jgi:O-antigen/teichoic acid export membrane protein
MIQRRWPHVPSRPGRLSDVARWWQSIAAMRRLSLVLIVIAAGGFLVGVVSWPLAIAIPALILATAAVLGALFTWFRLDELRELDRRGH